MIRRRKPLSRYWQVSAEADLARYPTVAALLEAMNQAGYVNVTAREIKKTSLTADATPFRERAFSCLRLIDDLQFEKGLRLLEEDLRKGPVRMTSECVCIWGEA